MNSPPHAANSDFRVYSTPLFLVLVAAGLTGNYFKFPIFLNIDFLFGSIFAMLALQFLGLTRGVAAAAMIASYTYVAWNHPYAIIIMTAEVAMVGWLFNRRKIGLVLADTLYWLCIGMPLVLLFYHVVMQVPLSNAFIVMIKQAVNGIANTLMARLIFSIYSLKTRTTLIQYRDIVYNLMAFFVLCPTLVMLAVDSRKDFSTTDLSIRSSLTHVRDVAHDRLETWIANRQIAIVNLAQLTAVSSPRQMQSFLELVKKTDINFLRVGLMDRDATTTAYFPLVDELGASNIGKNFADRPFIPIIRQSLKPMLSEVVMGRIGLTRPIVSMIAPALRRGTCNGFAIGILSLDQIRIHLEQITDSKNILYTLVDRNGNVVMSNRSDQKIMTPFTRGKGTVKRLDGTISQWVPVIPSNTPVSERWKKSVYIAEAGIGIQAEWKLILEQPVAPFQKTLYNTYSAKLSLLFLILLVSLTLAEFISRRIAETLGRLSALSHELSSKLNSDGMQITWPVSGFYESHHLITSISSMAQLISAQFVKIRQINESLEQRIRERTAQIEEIMLERSIIMDNAPMGICKLNDRRLVWTNSAAEALLLYSKEELEFQSTRMLYPSEEAYESLAREAYPALFRGLVFETIQELIRKDGAIILVRSIGKALDPRDTSKGTIWVLEDITERKRSEDALKKSEERYRAVVEDQTETIDRYRTDGTYTFVNDVFCRVFGKTRQELLGHTWYPEAFPEDVPIINEQLSLLSPSQPVVVIENRIFSSTGEVRWMQFVNRGFFDEEGRLVETQAVGRDITERKNLELKLAESELKYRTLVMNAPFLVTNIDRNGIIQFINRCSDGFDFERVLGTSSFNYLEGDSKQIYHEALERVFESKSSQEIVVQGFGDNHTLHWYETVLGPVVIDGQVVSVIQVSIDITERKRAEEMLKMAKTLLEHQVEERTASLSHALDQLSQENEERKRIELDLLDNQRKLEAMSIELSLAEERERDRIAGELHDQVGQRLIFSKMVLGSLASRANSDEFSAEIEELDNIIDLSIQDIRTLTFQLRPPLLASAGLEAALRWIGDEFCEKYGLLLSFSDDDQQKPIRYETRSTLFQAVRELLLNTVKHANARHIGIHIMRNDSLLILRVTDDGIGFDIEEARMRKSKTGGFGLINTQRRIEHLGGSVRIESSPGRGTCATLSAPLDIVGGEL